MQFSRLTLPPPKRQQTRNRPTATSNPPAIPGRFRDLRLALERQAHAGVLDIPEIQLDYDGAKDSRFRRRRVNLGGATADAHYAIDRDWRELMEYARDMDRNDGLMGQLVNRARDNIHGEGFRVSPDTGDKEADAYLEDQWESWAVDERRCDRAQRSTFHELAGLAYRHQVIDGDVFLLSGNTMLPEAEEWVQLIEGDRIYSRPYWHEDRVFGVAVDPQTGEHLSYRYYPVPPGQRKWRGYQQVLLGDWIEIPRVDECGNPWVIHLYDPARATQTRGITAFHAVFQTFGMLDDVQFAKLVQHQIVSWVGAVITSEGRADLGAQYEQQQIDSFGTQGTTRTLEELTPGIVARLRPGESIQTVSPSFAVSEWLDQARLLLRTIFAQIGMPLSLGLLDTSNTTFHGYRGELQQARLGFRVKQRLIRNRVYTPVYRARARRWLLEAGWDPDANPRLLRHSWQTPGFPYVDPKVDAEAERLRLSGGLDSLRRIHAERGRDWRQVAREQLEDRRLLIEGAIEQAEEIKASTGADVSWEQLAGIDLPAGVSVSTPTGGADPQAPTPEPMEEAA